MDIFVCFSPIKQQAGAGKFSDADGKFIALLKTSSTAQTKATFQGYKRVGSVYWAAWEKGFNYKNIVDEYI